MDRSELLEKLKGILEPYVQDKQALANLNEDTDFLEDLKINSANLVDIILDSEEVFDIEIDDDSAEKMMTVKAALAVFEEQIN